MLLALLLACAIQPVGLLVKFILHRDVLFGDFFALWSFGRFVDTQPPALIYDVATLHGFQLALGMSPDILYPFSYPPWLLLLLAPLGALPYTVAFLLFVALSFAAYAAALAAWRWRPVPAAILVLAPSSAVCFLLGQNGFLSAALMLGGLHVLRSRPMISGMLLGALAYKPQLAILVPFMLLFGQHGRAMAGAILAALVLSFAAIAVFGVDLWSAWLANTTRHAAVLTAGHDALLDKMPTITAAIRLLGGDALLAHLAQAAGAAAAIAAIWRVRARRDAGAQAVLPLATVLATPYAFAYDLPMVTGAVLAVIAARIAAADRFATFEFPALLGCILAPVILTAQVGAAAAIVPAVFAAALWTLARTRRPET